MTNNTTGQERALSDRDKVDALAKALCLLDSFAGDGLGHVYGNGQTLDADDVCLELAQAFDLEFDAGWWRTVAERALIGAPFPNSRKSRDAFIEAIREAAPNGEEIAVRYHANNDWSVANAPLYSLPHQPATGGGKGCPFCGGDDLLTGIQFGHDGVECKSCGAIGPRGDDADDAQERWKKRALSTTPPHTAETRLREVLERIADECEGTAPNGEPVGIASKCHRIARAALTQPEPTAQGGEEGEIVLGLRQARHVLKDLQAKNSDQTAYGKLAQTCDIAADRLTALSAQQGGEEDAATVREMALQAAADANSGYINSKTKRIVNAALNYVFAAQQAAGEAEAHRWLGPIPHDACEKPEWLPDDAIVMIAFNPRDSQNAMTWEFAEKRAAPARNRDWDAVTAFCVRVPLATPQQGQEVAQPEAWRGIERQQIVDWMRAHECSGGVTGELEPFDEAADAIERGDHMTFAVTNKAMTDGQIKQMVNRFLSWKLPDNFNPDGGIKFEPIGNPGSQYEYRRQPTGTNLLDATQAEAMVRHLVAALTAKAKDQA